MELKSFGCSFIYGSELSDVSTIDYERNPPASKLSWPALLAKKLNHTYQSFARPGAGNLYIAESVLNHASCCEPQLFVIGWTWIDRFEYFDSQNSWQCLTPGQDTELSHGYYRNYHSQYRDKLTTLINIKLCIDTLRSARHSFIMTAMDDLIFEADFHTSPAIIDLQDAIRSDISWFNNRTFLQWSQQCNFPISHLLHPLETAHEQAAELVFDNSDQWIKV